MTPTTSHPRPPILRFLVLFAALLGMALGLAALSPAAPADDNPDTVRSLRPGDAPQPPHPPR